MATITQRAFARKVYAAAQAVDIAPEFETAQAILESGWGKSAVGKYNLFGITKGSSWTGKTILVLTHEYFNTADVVFLAPEKVVSVCKCQNSDRYYYTVYRLFKDFSSLEDCLNEHARLLQKPGYADAWKYRHDAETFARKICDNVGCKYATDPNYLPTMLNLIKTVRSLCQK